MKIQFTVPGPPQGKARPRFAKSRTYTPQNTVAYEKLVRVKYRSAAIGVVPAEGAVSVTVLACYPIPKSASKAQRVKMLTGALKPTKKPDADNVAKIICDALNGLAYHHWAFEEPYSMREGVLKLAEEFNGEILWDNQDVKIGLYGEDRDFVVEYGGNMASFSRDSDVSEAATGVYIYYKDSKTYSGYSGPFTLADNPYGVTRHRLYNCADDVPSQPMSSNMEDIALAWLRRQEINPKTSITAKVTEVPEGMPIKLYDRVQVAHRVFGVYITARVVRVRYDVLRDRYKELEIGSLPKDIARTIAKMQKGAKG